MDLRQMRQFVAVAETLSLRRAAERLHMSQPPLTAAIRQLETDLGVVLLHRSRRGVSLTAAGAAFQAEARRTLAQAERTARVTRQAAQGKLGSLRLSYFPGATFRLLPLLLQRFLPDHPDVTLELSVAPTSRQSRQLADGSVDIALVMPAVTDAQGLALQAFAEESLVLAVPAAHTLAACAKVELRSLGGQAFVGLASDSDLAFEQLVAGMCQKSGFLPRLRMAAGDILTVLALVASGMGIALVPASLRRVHNPDIRFVEVVRGGNALSYPIALAYVPANDNPVVPAFLASASHRRSPGARATAGRKAAA